MQQRGRLLETTNAPEGRTMHGDNPETEEGLKKRGVLVEDAEAFLRGHPTAAGEEDGGEEVAAAAQTDGEGYRGARGGLACTLWQRGASGLKDVPRG